MSAYNPNDDSITYRMNLKWMKKRVLSLVNGYDYGERPNNYWNGWYLEIDENYDMYINDRKNNKNNFLCMEILRFANKMLPYICTGIQDYLITFSTESSDIAHYVSYGKTHIKHIYHKKFIIKLGMKTIYRTRGEI